MQGEIVTLIAEQRAALLAALSALGPDDWTRPTVCDPWTVKDVLAHMVEGELGVGRVYRLEVREQGYVDPEIGIERWRALPGEAVRAALWQHGIATQRALEAMTDEVWRTPIRAFGCREVRHLVRLHLFDLAVHGHDLTDAAGLDPVWHPCLEFLTEFVVRAAPLTLRRLDVAPGPAVRVAAGSRSWTIAHSDEGWTIDGEGAVATATFSPADLVLATTGRLDLDEAMARASIDGDAKALGALLEGWQVLREG